MGEADDQYALDNKRAEEEFLEKLKEGKPYEQVEKEYLQETQKIRTNYKKKLTKELNTKEKKKKKKEKKEKKEVFTVEKFSFEPTTKEKLKFKYETQKFKFQRRISALFRLRIFDYVRYMRYRIKYLMKNISELYDTIKEWCKEVLQSLWKFTKETFKKIIAVLKKLKDITLQGIKKVFKREKKEKDGKKDNKEGDKKTSEENSDDKASEPAKNASDDSKDNTTESK